MEGERGVGGLVGVRGLVGGEWEMARHAGMSAQSSASYKRAGCRRFGV